MSTPNTPSEAPTPETAQDKEGVFINASVETERELGRLREELDIDNAKIGGDHKEVEVVERFFRENKDKIMAITKVEAEKIKKAIHDANGEIEGKLQVSESGRIELKEDTKKTTDVIPTPETVDDGINTPAEAVEAMKEAVSSGSEVVAKKAEEALSYLGKISVMPEGIMKKITEFLHILFNWGDTRISYDQAKAFDSVISPYLKMRGFDLNTTTTNKQNQTRTSVDKEARVKTMQRLASLGIPLEESGKFFGFIMGDITDTNTIPTALVPLFEAGREHYKTLNLDTNTPLASVEAMLNFTPPQTAVADTADTDVGTTEEETVGEGEEEIAEVVIGEEKIVDTTENMTAYTSLRGAADKILGKKLDEKTLANKVKESKPEEKLHAASVEIFKQMVNMFREVYGPDYAKNLGDDIDKSTQNMLTDCLDGATKIEAKTLITISDMMTKNLDKIFWSGVTQLEKDITGWIAEASIEDENETTRYNYEVAQKLLTSVRGNGGRTGEKGELEIQKIVENEGYETLVQQNIAQIQNFREIKKTVTNEQTAIAYMNATPGLKTEIA